MRALNKLRGESLNALLKAEVSSEAYSFAITSSLTLTLLSVRSDAVKVRLDGARASGWTLRRLTAFYAGGACYGMPLSRSSPADDHCDA